jgi:WD40 repeat protein
MEGLKVLYDLKVMAQTLRIPILVHFFETFNPNQSKELTYTISKIHLKDYAASDYRSAYHQLCDWFYGWNVTDVMETTNADKGILTEQFTMKRVPRNINLEEKLEQSECLRIRSNYETLYTTARRSLNKVFLDIEEHVGKIGTNMAQVGVEKLGRDGGGEEFAGKRDIWAAAAMRDSQMLPDDVEELADMLEGVDDALRGEEETMGASLKGAKGLVSGIVNGGMAGGTAGKGPTPLYKTRSMAAANASKFSLVNVRGPPVGMLSVQDADAVQRDIDFCYEEVDRSIDFELMCATSGLIVLALSEALDEFVMYDKQSLLVHELSSDIISNTLITVWDLLQRELPKDTVTLTNIRDMRLMREMMTRVIEQRVDKTRLSRAARIPIKLGVLHRILSSMDIFLFPKQVEAHKEGLKACRYSSFDTNIWLTCGYDGLVRIFNLNTQEKLAQFAGHKSIVTDVAFGKNDATIVSSSFDRTLKLWNAYNAQCERTFTGHVDSITTSALSPEGRYIVSGAMDNSLRIWDVTTGHCLAVIRKHTRWIKVVRFSPDGRYFISAGLDLRIYVWDTKLAIRSKTIAPSRSFEIHNDYILSLETSRDGMLLTSSRDQTVKLCNYLSGNELYGISLAPSWACTLAFSDDGDMFATGSFDNNIMLFSTKKGERIRQLRVFNLGIQCVRFAKNYEYVVCGTREGLLQLIPI